LNFWNYLGWKNHQNKSCRSWNVMKLCNWHFLIWNHLIIEKIVWSFQIWNSNFVNGLGCRNYIKTKLGDLEKLCNFIIGHIFKWIHLMSQIIKLLSVCYSTWEIKTQYKHNWCSSVVVEECICEREVTSLNLTIHKTCKFNPK
jgi:hypothetical protein